MLPQTIVSPHQDDPLVVLPLPSPLPDSPLLQLPTLIAHLEDLLAAPGSRHALPSAVLVAQMRKINRDAHALLNAARVDAVESRAELDKRDTILRGVEYERNRIREEIDRCMDYVPAYTAAELPSTEDFLSSAPDSVKAGLAGLADEEHESAVIISQLEQQLKDIEAREADVEALTRDRDALARSRKDIKLKFDATETWMAEYTKTTSTLLNRLKAPLELTPPVLSAVSETKSMEEDDSMMHP